MTVHSDLSEADRPTGTVDLRLLGPVQLWSVGRSVGLGPRQQRLVLAVLALEVNALVAVERLVDLLWDQAPPRSARAVVHTHVSRVRSILAAAGGDMALVREGSAYALRGEPSAVDAHRFRDFVSQARNEVDNFRKVELLAQAQKLWRGPALADVADELLRERLCGDLHEARLTAAEDRFEALLRLGRHSTLVAELTALVAERPYRHRLVGQFMVALHRCGRTAEALAAYDRVRRWSIEQLGLDPALELRQLQVAILSDGPSVAAPTVVGSPPAGGGRGAARHHAYLPADVPEFTGRVRELARMAQLSESVLTVVIDGMAGVGKTALAVRFGHHVADAFPDGQMFIDLHGFTAGRRPVPPAEALDRLLRAADVPGTAIPVGLEDRAALWRATLAGRRMLVVLDNAADEDQVRLMSPGTVGCLVLVTSRRRLVGLDGARSLQLEAFPQTDAVTLFERVVDDPLRTGTQTGPVVDVVELCGRLPLAIRLAAARLAARPAWSVEYLRDRLNDHRYRLAELHAGQRSLVAALNISYEHLPADQQRMFRLLALHPGPDFDVLSAAALGATSHSQTERLLDGLLRAHLLLEPAPGRYRFHDLLHQHATQLLDSTDTADDREAGLRRLLDSYLRIAHSAALILDPHREPLLPRPPAPAFGATPDPADALTWFTTEHLALLALVQRAAAARHDSHAWQLAWTLVTFLDRRGSWPDQLTAQATASQVAHRLNRPVLEAYFEYTIGFGHTRLCRFDEAMTHYRRSLELYSQIGDSGGRAHTHRAIALALEYAGKPHEALEHAQHALTLSATLDDPFCLATALNAVGWLRSTVGEHHDALDYCQRALTLYQDIGHRGGAAHTWHSLGYIHHHLGHHDEAAACYQRALHGLQELGERYGLAEILIHLGEAQQAAGETSAAHQSWQQATAILDDFHHLDTRQLRTTLRDIQEADQRP